MSTDNSKEEVVLGRCDVYRPATAVFRIIIFTPFRGSFIDLISPHTPKETRSYNDRTGHM